MPDWLSDLETAAPDLVSAYRGIDAGRFISVRREVRKRGAEGSAGRVVDQLAASVGALAAIVARVPDEAFDAPGGEADWSVAEAIGHVADSRAGLSIAASLAAQGRFPAAAPEVVPGVPGERGQGRDALLRRLAMSQKVVERSARAIGGHELDPCPLVHPQVGRLRCGEWLLFAGVHDLMHVDQLRKIQASVGAGPAAVGRSRP